MRRNVTADGGRDRSRRGPHTVWTVTEPAPHMTPEQFRQHGHEVVDWIADYWIADRVASRCARRCLPARSARPSRPPPPSGASRSRPSWPTSTGSCSPGVTHWQHPGFFGYFPANTSGPSVLGDLVSAGLGVQGMSWVTSPAATELEQHVMDWLADLLGLPAVLPLRRAPAAASSRTPAPAPTSSPSWRPCTGPARARTLRHGVDPERATVYVSAETHSSMEKAVRIAGLGTDAVRIVEVDGDLAMRPGGARRTARAGRRPRLHAGAGLRHGRDDVDDRRRPAGRSSARSARSTASGCTSTPPTPASAPSSPSCASCRPASSGPTATRPTRTSGCSPASTRRCSGSPTARRSPAPCRSCPEYLRNAATDAGRRRRLPRLADPARPPLPRPEAVVRRCAGTAPRGCAPTSAAHVALAQELAGLGRGRRAVRRRHAAPARRWSACGPRWADDVDADVATMTLLERLNDGGEVFLTHTTVGGRWCSGWPSAPPPPPGRTSSGCGHCCARATTGWPPTSPRPPPSSAAEQERARAAAEEARAAAEPPESAAASPASGLPRAWTGPTPSVLRRPEQALLGHGGHVRAVGGPDLTEAQRTPRGRGRAVGLVEEPVVGPHRAVEPHRVVEARADEVLPRRRRAGRSRPTAASGR